MSLDYETLINGNDIVLVLFGLKDCGPCKAIKYKLETDISHPKINYLYLDLSQNESLCGQLGIYAAPTLIVYVLVKESIRENGIFSFELIKDKINYYLELME